MQLTVTYQSITGNSTQYSVNGLRGQRILKKEKKTNKNRSRVTGVENKQTMVTKGWGRINWETGMGIYIPLYIKEITDKHLRYMHSTGTHSIHYHGLYGKRNFKKTGCICVHTYTYTYTHIHTYKYMDN